MKIGIIIAMEKEFQLIRSLLGDVTEMEMHGRVYVTGTIAHNMVILHRCGIGKVNAAIGTAELISTFSPDAIVSTGVAGGASLSLNIQDVVVTSQTCYHDVYCGQDVAYGQVPGMPERFDADERLLHRATSLNCPVSIHQGLIVTGDWFVDTRGKMGEILDKFPDAIAVDMESAAIAHVCRQKSVAFIGFRIISDIPLSDHKAQQYYDFWNNVADKSFSVTKAFIESM